MTGIMGFLPIMALVGVLVFAGVSFLFAIAETALFALGKWQARKLAERHPDNGTIVLGLLAKPHDLLATIVLGDSIANGAVVVLGLWPAFGRDWPITLILVGLFVLILVGCEVMPKTLAVRLPEVWSLRIARPMRFCLTLTTPLRRIVQDFNATILNRLIPESVQPHASLTDEDYEELIELAYQQGTLDQSEREIIFSIVNLDQETVGDVMQPRAQIIGVPVGTPHEEIVEMARRYKHRRLVLYEDSLDTIVGFINTRTLLLNSGTDLEPATEFPFFVPESMNVLQLWKNMQRQQRGMVVVLDEFGGTAGLVTMEDIVEEMLGEIRSEGESEGFTLEKLGEGRWRVNGTTQIEDFAKECPAIGETEEVDTVGGLVTAQMEVVPKVGETMEYRGLRFTVLAADERRVREVLVERID